MATYEYALQANGTAVITGFGKDVCGEITIPEESEGHRVTEIGKSAFSDCRRLTGVTLPNSIKVLGDAAFFMCQIFCR